MTDRKDQERTRTNEGAIKRLLSVNEVAEILGVSQGTVHNYIHKESLPAYRIGERGSKIIIYEHEFQEWLQNREPVVRKGAYELLTSKL